MTAAIGRWVSGPLPREVDQALARLADTPDVKRVAVMPDVHLAHDVCIGVVTASSSTLFPEAVGGDIGCGISALRFNAHASVLEDQHAAARVFAGLYRRVPQNRHDVASARKRWPAALTPDALSHPSLQRLGRREGLVQLGTLGRGNHFLELQADDDDGLWAMVHSGSRAVGPAIRDCHLRAATERGRLRGLNADSDEGRAYLADLRWALAYAQASRAAMLAAVRDVLHDVFATEPEPHARIDCHHNFARQEEHGGEVFWVHRKGAISAAPGEPGIIAGSMGTPSYHTTGKGIEGSLCSSSHGAGRVMSRSDARRSVSPRDLAKQMRGVWFDHRRAGQLRDEAPAAYKDIDEVMRAQRELTRIERRLRPLLSFKGV